MTTLSTKSNNSGAISALKGYRTQFLYSLYRILSHKEDEDEFHPEGKYEDLDVYNCDNNVVEIIQVKHLKKVLSLSDIVSSKKENSFLKRAIDAHRNGGSPIIKLVSFGEINNDVKNLTNTDYSQSFINKLCKYGISKKDVESLKGNFQYEIVSEQNIKDKILTKLEEWSLLADAEITIDLLLYWIYYSAEKQLSISPSILKAQLEKISKFQRERIAFAETYNSLIQPLDENITTEDIERLKLDFYKGISATYNHILADVDVARIDKLNLIQEKLNDSNIVFVHGASGQGKSTLAYRFLKENCARTTVFELKYLPEDINTIYDVINSLEGISKGIRFPITIYLDVVPGTKEWINILSELASKKNFNFLVTIREEDWNSIEVGDKFNFSEIELTFEQEEAELIYAALDEYNKDLRFIDFMNAWDNFGGIGPLLEFVYLITQNESLSAKLSSQINKIRRDTSDLGKEKIALLRYIVLADCYGSKVKTKEFNQFLSLKNEILFLIDLLQKEYLIKISGDKSYIIGLHPVRSEIIKRILFDDEIYKEFDFALNALSFISDNTVLNFIRNAFRYSKLLPDLLIEKLKDFELKSWQMYFYTLKSLLWKGIDDYSQKNISVLNKIYSDYGKGWITVVNFDFANVIESGSMMENAEIFSEEQRQYAKTVNQEFSDKQEVFSYCKSWLSNIKSIDIIPQGKDEWNSFALFLFWLNHFNIKSVAIKFNEFEFDKNLKLQSLEVIAHTLYALKKFSSLSFKYSDITEKIFLQKLSIKYNIISIEQENNDISCHYLFDIIDEKFETDESDIINAKSMKIIDLLRFAFPDKDHYNTNGVGHQFSFLPSDYDSSFKQIPQKNLPLKPLVEINSTYLNLFNFTKRPNNWMEYVELIRNRRLFYIEVLNKLVTAFKETHRTKSYEPLRLYVLYYIEKNSELKKIINPLLPKNITDEWGEFGENGTKQAKITNPAISFQRYKSFEKLHNDLITSIENFLWQSANVFISKIKSKNEHTDFDIETARISLVGNLFRAYELVNKFHKKFNEHFSKYMSSGELMRIERAEVENISILSFLYRQFIYSDSFIAGNVSKVAINRLRESDSNFKKKINNGFKQFGKELGVKIKIDFNNAEHRCVILADYDFAIESFQLLELIYNKLYDIIEQPDYTSIKYLILSTKYPVFNICLLVAGKTINSTWYEFQLYNLREKKAEELEQFNLIPKEIPVEQIERYSIKSWNKELDEFKSLDKLLESTSLSYQLAFHFRQMKYFEDKTVEDYNEELLKKHIDKTGLLFQENLQTALDIYGNYAQMCNEDFIEFIDDEERLEFCNLLIDNHKNFYPNNELFEKAEFHLSIGASDFDTWIPRLEELVNNTSVIYYFMAGKIIEKELINYE